MNKLFVVVRGDLDPGPLLAQACHGCLAYAIEHHELARTWADLEKNLVVLEAPSEHELELLAVRAERAGLTVHGFVEPDLADSLTSIVLFGDGANRLVSSLPLALRAPRKRAAAPECAA